MGASNIVHRDLKPHNIVIRRADGSPVIVDLGISVDLELLDPGSTVIAGTPLFMPPESFDGAIDGAFDPYSLGVTATVAMTGEYPRLSGNIGDLIRHKRSGRFREEIVGMLGGIERSIAEWITALIEDRGAQRLAALHAGIL
jgi:serine/threonine-protein kinase